MFKKRLSGRHNTSSSVGSDSVAGSRTSNSTSTARNNSKKPKASSLKHSSGRSTPSNSHHSAAEHRARVSDRSLGSQTVSTRSSTGPKHVRFSNVEVREFERVLTNNPSCSSGAPIGLGWGFAKGKTIEVDDYESRRSARRTQAELVLSRQQREAIMLEWGASVHEIVDAVRSNVRAKNQRRHSVYSLGRYDRWEEMMQNAGRRLKRTILLQKTTGQKAKELSAQVQPCLMLKEPVIAEEHEENHEHPTGSPDVPHPPNGTAPSKPHSESTALIQHNLYAPEEYILGMSDPGMHEMSPAQYTTSRQESLSWSGTIQRVSATVMEVDLFRNNVDVSSQLSYDDDATTIDSSDEYDDDDGFGDLVRDTRHWYVDGYDAPHPQRRTVPTVISEDFNYFADHMHQPVLIVQQYQQQPVRYPGYEMEQLHYWEQRSPAVHYSY